MTMNILWIEGDQKASPSFVPDLQRKGHQVEAMHTGVAALVRIQSLDPDLIGVNAAPLRPRGRSICHAVRDMREDLPILLNCAEMKMNGWLEVDQILALPFNLRNCSR